MNKRLVNDLGDGYFEQQFVLQQIGTLTGKKYLGDYGSDMEQFAALMNAGGTVNSFAQISSDILAEV